MTHTRTLTDANFLLVYLEKCFGKTVYYYYYYYCSVLCVLRKNCVLLFVVWHKNYRTCYRGDDSVATILKVISEN